MFFFPVIYEPNLLPTGTKPRLTPRRNNVRPIITNKTESRNCQIGIVVSNTERNRPRTIAIKAIGKTEMQTSLSCLKNPIQYSLLKS